MSAVTSLGYVVVSSGDLEGWESFATGLLGLQVAGRTPESLVLRADRYRSRVRVEQGDAEGVVVLGWEVAGPAELDSLAARLCDAGYDVVRESTVRARQRGVTGLLSFVDPDGLGVELFYGQEVDPRPFVSPTGARFVTGAGGLGHVFQLVEDEAAFRRLYLEVLGFRVSDYIDLGSLVGTFLHCNPRHHSYAFAAVPGRSRGVGHLMLEVDDLDVLGRAYDRVVKDAAAPLAISLGRHTNDRMVSFYVNSPSGFEVEYGTGGILVDDATWRASRYDRPNAWGHEHLRVRV
jgi:3,4-dihydroxy-9,10-secoandrosta-1,3,5(10)-triene-9,17-dione 4,5-dioxygenase